MQPNEMRPLTSSNASDESIGCLNENEKGK